MSKTGTEQPKKRTWKRSLVATIVLFCCLDANVSLFLYDKIFASHSHLRSTFSGKRVWITGASSGIGTEFAKQLADNGAHVILSSRSAPRLEEVLEKSDSLVKERTDIVTFDMMGSSQEFQDAVDEALSGGEIDILILNAAVFQERPALLTDSSETKELLKVNFEGPVQIATELINRGNWKSKGKGHIMIVSSRFGKIPGPLSSSYSATKFALHGFFNSLCAENPWLRVDFALPGPVDTNLYKGAMKKKGKESFYASFPRQMQSPQRVAQLAISGMSGPAFLFYEMWISKPFALFGYYQNQYFPTWARQSHSVFGKFAMDCYQYGNVEAKAAWGWPKPPEK